MANTCEERSDEQVVALQQASFEESKDQAAWVGVLYKFNTLRDTEEAVQQSIMSENSI